MDEKIHQQILLKFQALKGQVIYGKKQLKGVATGGSKGTWKIKLKTF